VHLEVLTNSLKQEREKKSSGEAENKMSLFADNGQLKPDIAKSVVNKESDSYLGMLTKSHSKAKYL
jgi:hypothetical protein